MKVKIYQWTGYLCKSLREEENKYILDNLNQWHSDYSEGGYDSKDLSFYGYVSMMVALEQMRIGLYRASHPLINPVSGYNKSWLKYQIRKIRR